MRSIHCALAGLLLLFAACSSPAGPNHDLPRFDDPAPEPLPGMARLLRVERLTAHAEGSAVSLEVVGTLPDPCWSIQPTQARQGRRFDVTLAITRLDAICAAVITRVTIAVPLQGPFPPGEYVVHVNGNELHFQI